MSNVIATNDGYINKTATAYATARNAIVGDSAPTNLFSVGQGKSDYYIQRGFASFVIPDMSVLTAASLFLYGSLDGSTIDFYIYLLESTYSNPLIKEDFDLFDGHQSSGVYNGTVLNETWNSLDYIAGWNEIVFNSDGLAAILAKKNDTFKLAAISGEDYNNSAPINSEVLYFKSSVTSGKEPYLALTFSSPVHMSGLSASQVLSSGKLGLTLPLSGVSASKIIASCIINIVHELSGRSNSELKSSLTLFLGDIKNLSGVSASSVLSSMSITLGSTELLSGVSASKVTVNMVIQQVIELRASIESKVSSRMYLQGNEAQTGFITRY